MELKEFQDCGLRQAVRMYVNENSLGVSVERVEEALLPDLRLFFEAQPRDFHEATVYTRGLLDGLIIGKRLFCREL
jgi:hypothetical protein